MQPIISDLLLASSTLPGVKYVNLLGRNGGVDTNACTIWAPGNNYAQLTSAVAMEAVSGSANDAAAGTGARTIEADMVDGNYAQTTVTITMNGTTPVAISGTYLACNGIRVVTAGSGLTNAGAIDIRVVSGAAVKRRINSSATAGLGLGQSADFLYTVPANCIAVLGDIHFSGITVTGALQVWVRSYNSSGVYRDEGAGQSSLYVTAFNGSVGRVHFGAGKRFPEKTLIEGRTVVSAGSSAIIAQAGLAVIDTTDCTWAQ